MSTSSHNDDDVELTVAFRGLRISVSGPASEALRLVTELTSSSQPSTFGDRISSAAETESIGSYTVVSALEEQRQPVRRGETRDEIERSFGRCPRHLFAQASRLVGPVELCERRIERAWLAGRWAGAVVAGRASSPNRTEQLAVRSRVYIILRAPGLESPKVVHSSADYFRVVGRLHDSSSLSHSFPSETEARIYCEAAGFTYPISQQQ